MNRAYQICTRCIMDTSDEEITFNSNGECNHCNNFNNITRKEWYPNEEGKKRWAVIADQIRATGKGQQYDCIIGLSGGVDSSYLALKVKEIGLKPLVVHVDAGWNSELAVANIEKIVNYCDFDLYTHVVDWEEIRDLQLAFMRSGVANQDVPQDHAFFSNLYRFAIKNKIRYVLSGGNIATESIFPSSWHGSAMDAINLKAIHRKYGQKPLKTYKTISFFNYYLWYPFVKKMIAVRPLNYMPFDKEMAIQELQQTIGWRSYGRKHGESLYTKLFQNYYLPERFGYDKRRPHLSSLIMSEQTTRGKAILEIKKPLYDQQELEDDIVFFCKKLRISREVFDDLLKAPLSHYTNFNNWDKRYSTLKNIQNNIENLFGKSLSRYS